MCVVVPRRGAPPPRRRARRPDEAAFFLATPLGALTFRTLRPSCCCTTHRRVFLALLLGRRAARTRRRTCAQHCCWSAAEIDKRTRKHVCCYCTPHPQKRGRHAGRPAVRRSPGGKRRAQRTANGGGTTLPKNVGVCMAAAARCQKGDGRAAPRRAQRPQRDAAGGDWAPKVRRKNSAARVVMSARAPMMPSTAAPGARKKNAMMRKWDGRVGKVAN